MGSLTPSELQQVSSNLPPDLQQELLNEDDGGENDEFRNSQKFKYEQCKQAAFSLLMRVAQNLESFDENEQKVPEDVEELMLETWEQLSANVVYEKRDWQTQAYKVNFATLHVFVRWELFIFMFKFHGSIPTSKSTWQIAGSNQSYKTFILFSMSTE